MQLITSKNSKEPSIVNVAARAKDHHQREVLLLDITFASLRGQRKGSYGYISITDANGAAVAIDPNTKTVSLADAQDVFEQVCALTGTSASDWAEIVIDIIHYNTCADPTGRDLDLTADEQVELFGRPPHDVKPKKKYIFAPHKNRLQIMQGGDYVYENYDGVITRDGAAVAES